MSRFALILFDLDGTLVETAPEIGDAVNDTLRHFALPTVTQQQVTDWIGHGTLELLIQALASVQGQPVSVVRASKALPIIAAEFKVHYRARCGTRSRCYPGVKDTLLRLRAQGIHLGVVTNKEGAYTQIVLDAHGLSPMFEVVISGDTLSSKKPHPQGIQLCIERFGLTVQEVLFVGDSSIDVATARNAGVAVWVLPYGYNMGQPIENSLPDRVLADFSQIG
jgi:phosphoglycolate phosphatase